MIRMEGEGFFFSLFLRGGRRVGGVEGGFSTDKGLKLLAWNHKKD